MKTINLIKSLLFLSVGTLMLLSCQQEEGPSIEDYSLNYQISEIAPVDGIGVGAFYTNNPYSNDTARYRRLISEYDPDATPYPQLCPNVRPVLGYYSYDLNSVNTVDLIQQHINWAVEGGINFFILPKINYDANQMNYLNQGTLNFYNYAEGMHENSLDLIHWGNFKFCTQVQPSEVASGTSATIMLEDDTDANGYSPRMEKLVNYFRGLANRFFTDDTLYYPVDGKPLIIVLNPQDLHCRDSKAVYDSIRAVVREVSGKEIYLVARQNCWTPTARFENFFLTGGVDALFMNNMYNQTLQQRAYLYPQSINENWKYNREWALSNYNIDFVPNISPGFNAWLSNQGTDRYNYPLMNYDVNTFRTMCNVAKMNLGNNKLVFIDSFNDWTWATALEPTDPYFGKGFGMQLLDVIREEFKR